MYPIALDVSNLYIALIGNGRAITKRYQQLLEAGATSLTVYADAPAKKLEQAVGTALIRSIPEVSELEKYQIVMIADIPDEQAFALAKQVREMGRLVNVEDRREYCDFYFSSLVRRGDLLLSVNTNGKSPALSVRIRKWLEDAFPAAWEARVKEIGAKRSEWKKENCSFQEVTEKTNSFINQRGWLNGCPYKRFIRAFRRSGK